MRDKLHPPTRSTRRWIAVVLSVAAAACARDDSLKVFYEDPVAPKVKITEPGTNQRFVKNTLATFQATVSDADDDTEELSVTWRSDVAGTLEGSGELMDGVHTFRTDELSLGSHTITVEVVDPDTETATDSVLVSVVRNSSPKIVITAPESESIWPESHTVWVAAVVNDNEDEVEALRVEWTLDGEWVLSASSEPSAAGEVTHGFEGIGVNAHTVEITVIDVQGATSSSSVEFNVIYGDDDGDGFISVIVGGEDCDDTDPDVNPDADEICDEIDNDCDGLIDAEDDSLTDGHAGHLDSDGDGFGQPDAAISCDPDALISDGSDCDDTDAAINPAAEEICNELDDDCDALIDGDDPDTDHDGDGFSVCDDDCDDTDPTVSPDATEFCDEVDNDCDGSVDGATATDAITFYVDADGDGYGSEESVTLACTEPSGHSSDTTDCNDGDPEIHPGAVEVCGDGIDNDCDGAPGDCKWTGEVVLEDASHVTYGESAEDQVASALASGDLDGDGQADLIIGAYKADPSAMNSGAVYLVPGPLTETWGSLESHASLRLDGEDLSDWAGEALIVEDLDGDGWDDLVVGAPQADMAPGSNSGAAFVYYGPIIDSGMLLDGDASISGETGSDRLGKGMHAGDIDGDGIADLAIGAEDNNTYASDAGAVYLFLGSSSRLAGDLDAADADTRLYSNQANMNLGQQIVVASDVNGDGRDDLLIAAPRSDDTDESAGAVYLFLGHETDYGLGNAFLHTVAQAEYLGSASRDYAGTSLVDLGDVDGDGRAEFAIGAPNVDSATTSDDEIGTVYLMLNPALSGASDLEASADIRIRGAIDNNFLGESLAANFDLDADGNTDLAIGAPNERREWAYVGVTYLIYGPITDLPAELTVTGGEDASFVGEAASDQAGRVLLGADLNDDGLDDLSIGAPGMSPTSGMSDAGATYVLFGGGM